MKFVQKFLLMCKYPLLLMAGFHCSVFAETADCGPEPCSETYSTDVAEAKDFGVIISLTSINSPSLTDITISQREVNECSLGGLDIVIGKEPSGREPNALVSFKSIDAVDGIILRNDLVNSSSIIIDINCSGNMGEKWKRNVKQILDVRLEL
ncbi:hypothetical protein OOT55_13555 [Marinimicrobium sp. C6131]|uniref:hypothetical protein n=1 Tax=Marinimicrobium sp. C6131 TaxID=3022676 RepID=UPI00223D2D90|nr:hypothetical protein [Marinimicrobium sp. C6131]UZJ43676.1 hypothetical protein OOT55_13555 [Marinimicrobium sp. C6131]